MKERNQLNEHIAKERAEIEKKVREAAKAVDLSSVQLRIRSAHVWNGKIDTAPEAEFYIPLTEELKKRIIAADKLRENPVLKGELPSISEIERQLRSELNGQPSDRIGAVLKDEDTVKMLDALLGKIDRRAEKRQLTDESVTV